MLNSKDKELWTTALRSGDYKQCRDSLQTDRRKLCAIGVGYCVIPHSVKRTIAEIQYDRDPTETAAYAIGIIDLDNAMSRLVAMNDKEKKSFSEIADWIDANL